MSTADFLKLLSYGVGKFKSVKVESEDEKKNRAVDYTTELASPYAEETIPTAKVNARFTIAGSILQFDEKAHNMDQSVPAILVGLNEGEYNEDRPDRTSRSGSQALQHLYEIESHEEGAYLECDDKEVDMGQLVTRQEFRDTLLHSPNRGLHEGAAGINSVCSRVVAMELIERRHFKESEEAVRLRNVLHLFACK
jgi:hypothetical protein